MYPKKLHKKKTPSKASRGKFSPKVIAEILERDNEVCVLCSAQAEDIHHVKFKSQNGRNVATNGVCICRDCHDLAHSIEAIRKQLEDMQIERFGEDYYKDEYDL